MRVILPTLVAVVALAASSVQAAPLPSKVSQHARWHETPAQNVRKSQQYDYLVSTNGGFRAYRMRKECGPITDPALRTECMASFSEYEPARR
jgi:predicted transcriptional regulator